MDSEKREATETQEPQECGCGKDLTVRVICYEDACKLGDAICVKYCKAFESLKDK